MEKDYQGFIFNKISADVVAGRKGKNLLKKSWKLNIVKGEKATPQKNANFKLIRFVESGNQNK